MLTVFINVFVGLHAIAVGFIMGYYFCKVRYNVKGLLRALHCLSDMLSGKITAEKALEIMNEISPDKK